VSDSPLISIVLPTYNRGYTLSNALKSVIEQTYPHWELIVVDDGSTDDTKQVVASFNDSRIKYVYQENARQSAARNTGLTRASGDWICYLDSDDVFLPNYLEVMMQDLKDHPHAVFAIPKGHRLIELYENGKLIFSRDETDREFAKDPTSEGISRRTFHVMCDGLMHSSRIVADGIRFDENLIYSEDWEFVLTLNEAYPGGFLFVPHLLYIYRMRFGGDGMVSSTDYASMAEVYKYIYEKHKDDRSMNGQDWYPRKYEEFLNLEKDYIAGRIPAFNLYYFKEIWKDQYPK